MQDALQKFVYDQALTAPADDVRVRCPACGPNRKLIHRNDRSLSITLHGDRATFFCHHCSAKGAVSMRENVTPLRRPAPPKAERKVLSTEPLTEEALSFLALRGISAVNAVGAGVTSARVWFRELKREGEGVAFPYLDAEGFPAWKVRSIEGKEFSCVGSPRSFFNSPPDGSQVDTLVITEGELDALSALEAGFPFSVSVPNGALNKPLTDGEVEDAQGGKLGFLWAHRKLLDSAKRVVLATDADAQGQIMAEEIARRVGKAKCFLVSFPDGCKDLNDVLKQHDASVAARLIDEALPFKIAGLHSVDEYQAHVDDLYYNGLQGGASTGWPSVDNIMTVQPGMLYIVTGIPGHGKSSWIDALTVNLAKQNGWTTVMASFENPPHIHISKLISCYAELPFGSGHSKRITPERLAEATKWVSQHYLFMSNDEEPPSVQSILDRARAGILRLGAKVVVMDPANFLQFKNSENDRNDEIDNALTQFRAFAAAHDVAFFLVAHPRKPGNDTSSSWYPQGYSIAGTAGYFNRPDVGVTIHRTEEDFTRVIVWKARFGHIAKNGEAMLSYEPSTGTFTESTVRPQKAEGESKWWEDL